MTENLQQNCVIEGWTDAHTERFWLHVATADPALCWPWMLTPTKQGYGSFAVGTKNMPVHRIAWMLCNQRKLSRHELVFQNCYNRLCCNPLCLRVGNFVDQGKRATERGVHDGTKNGNATMTEEFVSEIRKKLATGMPIHRVAKFFGRGVTGINKIARGKSWDHVGGAVEGAAVGTAGENYGGAKLTWAAVDQARAWLAAGFTQHEVARRLGVSTGAIDLMKTGKNWKDCDRPPIIPAPHATDIAKWSQFPAYPAERLCINCSSPIQVAPRLSVRNYCDNIECRRLIANERTKLAFAVDPERRAKKAARRKLTDQNKRASRDWRWNSDKELRLYNAEGVLRVILRKCKMKDGGIYWNFYTPDGEPLMAGSQMDQHAYRISKRSAQSSAEFYADTGVIYP